MVRVITSVEIWTDAVLAEIDRLPFLMAIWQSLDDDQRYSALIRWEARVCGHCLDLTWRLCRQPVCGVLPPPLREIRTALLDHAAIIEVLGLPWPDVLPRVRRRR